MALLVEFIEGLPSEILGGGLNDSLMFLLLLGCAKKVIKC